MNSETCIVAIKGILTTCYMYRGIALEPGQSNHRGGRQWIMHGKFLSYDPASEKEIPVQGFVFENWHSAQSAIDSMLRKQSKEPVV